TPGQSMALGARGGLPRYDEACRAIAAAKSVDEVKESHDKAEAMRAYARQAKNRELEVDAAEIRMRAERRLGELIIRQKETVGLNAGKRGDRGTRAAPRSDTRPTLAETGIDKKLSSRSQKLAAVTETKFDQLLEQWRERIERENERITTDLLRQDDKA